MDSYCAVHGMPTSSACLAVQREGAVAIEHIPISLTGWPPALALMNSSIKCCDRGPRGHFWAMWWREWPSISTYLHCLLAASSLHREASLNIVHFLLPWSRCQDGISVCIYLIMSFVAYKEHAMDELSDELTRTLAEAGEGLKAFQDEVIE